MTKKSKTKRIKTEKHQTEEQNEIIRFVRILVIIIILVLGVYLFTRIFVTKDLFNKDKEPDTVTPGTINYNVTNIGSMFNKNEKEYYVMLYNSKDVNAVYYSGLITTYQRNEDAIKIYFADLNNELNKKYVSEENENVNTSDLTTFKVGDLALLKIKEGQISKSLTSEEDIASELAYNNEE